MLKLLKKILEFFRTLKKKNKVPVNGKTVGIGAGIGAAASAVALAITPMIQSHEGLRTEAYRDPVGIPTICFGETLGVKMGDKKTVEECHEILQPRLLGFLTTMRNCTEPDLPLKTEAAFLSFTYNLGSGVYCQNIAEKRLNKGNLNEACNALLLYTKAGGKELPGLVRRRAEEHELCIAGLEEAGMIK